MIQQTGNPVFINDILINAMAPIAMRNGNCGTKGRQSISESASQILIGS